MENRQMEIKEKENQTDVSNSNDIRAVQRLMSSYRHDNNGKQKNETHIFFLYDWGNTIELILTMHVQKLRNRRD